MSSEALRVLGPEINEPIADQDTINKIVEASLPDRINYASILAGGKCSAGCYFCIGRGLRGEDESAHTGQDWEGFLRGVSGRVGPYMSLSGTNSDPTLLKDVNEIITASQKSGFVVSLHTNGYSPKQEAYELSDKITISNHSFDPETFSSVMRAPEAMFQRVMDNIERWAPTGKLKLSTTYLPENSEEISSGRYFDHAKEMGIKRVVVRKFTEWEQHPVLPETATLIGEYHDEPVFDVNGIEVTIWDYSISNKSLPAIFYWPNGRIEQNQAWESLSE